MQPDVRRRADTLSWFEKAHKVPIIRVSRLHRRGAEDAEIGRAFSRDIINHGWWYSKSR